MSFHYVNILQESANFLREIFQMLEHTQIYSITYILYILYIKTYYVKEKAVFYGEDSMPEQKATPPEGKKTRNTIKNSFSFVACRKCSTLKSKT